MPMSPDARRVLNEMSPETVRLVYGGKVPSTRRPEEGEGVALTDPTRDPLASETEERVGQLAVCSIGYIGRVEGRGWMPYGRWAWFGTSLHGKPWSSTRPRWLNDEDRRALAPLFERVPRATVLSAGVPEEERAV